jgi:hypothetical protein
MSHLFAPPKQEQDAFGRLRISDPFTLGDYKHIFYLNPEFINTVSGAGSSVYYDKNQSAAILQVGVTSDAYAIHQTRQYHPYAPGKSQLILSSINFKEAVPNNIRRTGYFDDHNGIFVEVDASGRINFVIRSDVSGVISERRVTQSDWNKDPLNGGGPSGYNININKTQLFITDFEWLGVGVVRCGFAIDGRNIICHEFYNANNLETVYMRMPNLPVRCEIRNVGTIGAATSFTQICSTVISEGGYEETGFEWSHTTPLRSISVGSSLPAITIKLKNTFKDDKNRVNVKLTNVSVFAVGGNVRYEIVKIPTSVGINTSGTWISENDNSAVEYNQTATGISSVYYEDVSGGYAAGSSQNANVVNGSSSTAQIGPKAKKNFICQNYDSTDSELFSVRVYNIDSSYTAQVGVSIHWKEIY